MEGLLILLGIVAVITLVVLPIVVLVTVKTTENRVRGVEKEVQNMRGELHAALKNREGAVGVTPAPAVATPATPLTAPAVAAAAAAAAAAAVHSPRVEKVSAEPVSPQPVSSVAAPEATPAPQPIAASQPAIPRQAPIQAPTPVRPAAALARPAKERKPLINPAILTDNWLSKVGIITLVLGIGFFVKYAIDQDWINEIGRVGIGILTGALIIGIAHKLRKKYDVFSSILVGGGISVLYITITLAFREYHIFGQTAAFAILVGITLFSVVLSLLYDRKELALFSLLGGYASPLMISTGEGNYIVLFSFILILNAGMLLVSARKHWPIIGIVSYVCTWAFFWAWLANSFEAQYVGAAVFAALFFVQFYLLAIFDHIKSKKIAPFQVILVLSNNLSLFFACTLIFHNHPAKIMGLVSVMVALVNAVVLAVLIRRKEVDKNMLFLIIGIVMSFVSLAVPVQLNGHVITMFWAVEAVLLLWLWQRSRIRVFNIGFVLISALMLISYFMDAAHNYAVDYTGEAVRLAIIVNRMFITGAVVIASLALCRLMLRRDKAADPKSKGNMLTMRALEIGVVAMGYLVPLLEMGYQLNDSPIYNFSKVVLLSYTALYVAILAFIYRRRLPENRWMVVTLFAAIVLYIAAVLPAVASLRYSVFQSQYLVDASELEAVVSRAYFLIRYLGLLPLVYIFYAVISNLGSLSRGISNVLSWLLVAAAVTVLSCEAGNTAIQLWGNGENQYGILHNVSTFGYPILWGLSAMVLMMWGLKRKNVLLRLISLVFFGLIIVKFYAVDVWRMTQTGRILSFVVLGVILLLVSFLQQRIKTLVKDGDNKEKNAE